MAEIIETKNGVTSIEAKSREILRVNYTDTKETHLIISKDATGIWNTDNPDEGTQVADIDFATDEEVEQAIQDIIDSYEQGGN